MDVELQRALQVFLATDQNAEQAGSERRADGDRVVGAQARSSKALALGLRSEGFTNIREYAVLPPATAPRWIVPLGKPSWMVNGLRICAPFKPSAQILKRLLVPMARLGWTGWSRDRILLASRESLPIESLVHEITGEPNPVFAFLLGTPGKFRKLTVQVMRPDGEILGYIKLPLTPEASERIRRESTVLEQLNNSADLRSQVPTLLYAGAWSSGHFLFQSGGPAELGPIQFGPLCRNFLNKLWNFKRVDKPGSALVEEVGERWRRVESKLDASWRALAAAVLTRASDALQNVNVRCGIMHGDFAPWNTRLSNGQLYVFDWESATEDAPRLWDVFHYHAQVGSLLRRRVGTGLEPNCQKSDAALLLLYLLHSACDTVQETSAGSSRSLDYRRELITAQLSN
jgi:hypothetical protein